MQNHNNWVSNHKTVLALLVLCLSAAVNSCQAQNESGKQLLTLGQTINLPGVKGRIDHIDINIKDQIAYVAALGNNTVEIVDLKNGKVVGSIKGLDEPQGVAYIAKHSEIFVANGGTGECIFYNATTLKKTGTIKFSDDADDVRYDADADRIYVGYGTGGIAIIDAASHKQIGNIPLPAHPESFQLNAKAGKLWVNLPGSGAVGVADLKQLKLTAKWSKLFPRSNFPMAYDESQHRLMVGYRLPARLIVYSEAGKELYNSAMVSDADDLYWDQRTKQIFVSGGGGSIDIFKQTGVNSYSLIEKIKTPDGARTSLLVPEQRMFILAVRETGDLPAKLAVYKLAQ